MTLLRQAGVQGLGVAAVIGWSAIASVAILLVVKRLVGLRASDIAIEDGLDFSEHGERAYPI